MNQTQPKSKVLKWLLIILGIVIVIGILDYFFYIRKPATTELATNINPTFTPKTSPTATLNNSPVQPGGISAAPTDNQPQITQNPNLINFTYNTLDSKWPQDITVEFDGLGKTFDKNLLVLQDGSKKLIVFGVDYSYYPTTDAISCARADASGNYRNAMPDSFTYTDPVSLTVSGLAAASYKWTRVGEHTGTTHGIVVEVLVYPGVGQKAFEINGNLDNMSESDFNRVLQSITIKT